MLSALRRCAGLSLCLFWLTGCAVKPVEMHGKPDLALQQRLSALQRWAVTGKLAVRAPDVSESAHIQWQQDGKAFDIHLSGPAGLKATRIHGVPDDVDFEQGDRHINADSVEALSEQLTGWPLPASELTWWLRGLPAPDNRIKTVGYARDGWLAHLVQGDWTIDFSDPQQPATGMTLPGRIEASRGSARITLIIKTWQAD